MSVRRPEAGGAPFELIEAGLQDLATLAALERSCFDSPWSVEELATYFGSGAVVGFRLLVGGAVAPGAYALFQLLPDECELLRIGVEPGERGRGIATELLGRALERLAGEGREVCHLEVRADNAAARTLYERLGFRLVGRRRGYYADREDALRYRRGPRRGAG
jgi:[ribosomal protein S18]-alanine N-acetyltransferase